MSDAKKWIGPLTVLAIVAAIALVAVRFNVISFRSSSGDKPASVDLRDFAALPYTHFVTESEERKQMVGVTAHKESLANPGVNLYCNQFHDTVGAYLIDMKGKVIHQWQTPHKGTLGLATMDGEGNVYGLGVGRLLKIDWNSNVVFESPGAYHHDIEFRADGSLVTLRQETELINHEGKGIYILNDYLTFISQGGQVTNDVSLFHVLWESEAVQRVMDEATPSRNVLDLLHTNTCDVLEQDVPGFCKKGDILICVRNLDMIVVYDDDAHEIVWQYQAKDVWEHPHQPSLLRNGRVLILDNGYKRGWSRLLEIDLMAKDILWEYKEKPWESFYTALGGSVQRLANGNTLVTESDRGRVFEVTKRGKIVWEWFNPLFNEDGERATVYRMKRLEKSTVDAWMANEVRTQ